MTNMPKRIWADYDMDIPVWIEHGRIGGTEYIRADAIDTEALARLLVNDLLIHALIPSAYEPGVLVNFKRVLDTALSKEAADGEQG